ncbi:MAG: CorA family divalent cation transporter, partial [Solirubrobacterales bacterium]
IIHAHQRIWDLLENYKEVIDALEETNDTFLSPRVNDALRVLTAITVIVLPLTLIASIFGMNVGLPGGGDPEGGSMVTFAVVIGVMVAVLAGMVAWFRKRRWL